MIAPRIEDDVLVFGFGGNDQLPQRIEFRAALVGDCLRGVAEARRRDRPAVVGEFALGRQPGGDLFPEIVPGRALSRFVPLRSAVVGL